MTTVKFESVATRSLGLSRTETRGKGHSDLKVVIDILRPNMYPHTKGVRALRGLFSLIWSPNLKIAFHQFLQIVLLEEKLKCKILPFI